MMMIMLKMERFSLSQGNALIDVTLGHEAFISYVIIPWCFMIFVVNWILFHKLGWPCFEPRQFNFLIWVSFILILEKWMWTFYSFEILLFKCVLKFLISYAFTFCLLHIYVRDRGCHEWEFKSYPTYGANVVLVIWGDNQTRVLAADSDGLNDGSWW